MRTLILFALLLSPARAFDIPLTKGQRAQKLVEEGAALLLRGDEKGALAACERALAIRPDWAPAYVCRCQVRLRGNDPHADEDARLAMRYDPKSGEPFRLLGLWDFSAGRYGAAVKDFDKALDFAKLKPIDVTQCYYYRSRAKLSARDVEGAWQDVEKAWNSLDGLERLRGDMDIASLRAEILRWKGDLRGADAEERKVIEMIGRSLGRSRAGSPELLRRRALSSIRTGDYGAAAADYGEIAAASTSDVAARVDEALLLSMAGRYDGAARALDAALTLRPRSLAARHARVLARTAAGDAGGAVADMDFIMASSAGARTSWAEAGLSEKDIAWVRARPRSASLLGRQALLVEMLLDHADASDLAKKALAENGDDFAAHLALAQAKALGGGCSDSMPSLDWLVRRSPAQGYYRWLRGECRCGRGEFEGCVQDFASLVESEPAAVVPAGRLARCSRLALDRQSKPLTLAALQACLSRYEHALSLGALGPADRLAFIRTRVEAAVRTPPEQRKAVFLKAASDCAALLKLAEGDQSLRRSCAQVERRLVELPDPGRRR